MPSNSEFDVNVSFKPRPLGNQVLRTIAIFQAVVAAIATIILGTIAFLLLVFPVAAGIAYYAFFAHLITSLMSLGIVFVVIVQRCADMSALAMLKFEGIKSALATCLWLWLFIDSLVEPNQFAEGQWKAFKEAETRGRVAQVVTVGLILLILFYPALGYAWKKWNQAKRQFVFKEIELTDNERLSVDSESQGDEERLLSHVD